MTKSKRIICRITEKLDSDLQQLTVALERSEAQIIRQALEDFILKVKAQNGESWYDSAIRYGILRSGTLKNKNLAKLPSDLSTNKKYFEGFGQ